MCKRRIKKLTTLQPQPYNNEETKMVKRIIAVILELLLRSLDVVLLTHPC